METRFQDRETRSSAPAGARVGKALDLKSSRSAGRPPSGPGCVRVIRQARGIREMRDRAGWDRHRRDGRTHAWI